MPLVRAYRGNARVKATFWLLEAPNSLRAQSHRNADGAGLGFFGPTGEPVLDKQPEPAFSDRNSSAKPGRPSLLGLRGARPVGDDRRADDA